MSKKNITKKYQSQTNTPSTEKRVTFSRNPMELHYGVEEKVITSSDEIQPSVILRNREPKGRCGISSLI